MRNAGFMETLVRRHDEIMTKYDPDKRVALVVPTATTTLCAILTPRGGITDHRRTMLIQISIQATPHTIPTTPTTCFGEGACIRVDPLILIYQTSPLRVLLSAMDMSSAIILYLS